MSDLDCALAIVGGGPAGSTLALALARAENVDPGDVVLLERARHPREKPCAGAISAFGVAALEELGVPLEVPHAPMNGVRVLRNGEVGVLRMPLGVVVRRNELDASLFRRAAEDGIRTLEGEPLVGLERGKAGFLLRTPVRKIRARLLAACDGAGSPTRKLLGLREPARKGHLYVTETAETEADEGTRGDLCDFDLEPLRDGLQGYYWDFPAVIDGKRCVSRGVYHANFEASKAVKASLARSLAKRNVRMEDVELKPFSTRPFVPESVLAGDGYALVGEAAGIDRTTGEGIAQAIVFGRMAARHLARALRSGSTSLDGYDRDVRTSLVGRHLLQSAWLAPRVYGPRGKAFQDYLIRSAFARDAAARWYEGQALGTLTVLRLALGLARQWMS